MLLSSKPSRVRVCRAEPLGFKLCRNSTRRSNKQSHAQRTGGCVLIPKVTESASNPAIGQMQPVGVKRSPINFAW
jgi:hypothetical protein